MGHRKITRRSALRTLGLCAIGSVAATTDVAASTDVTPDGRRDDNRVQFVEADPDAGFNFPYWLATPETYRSDPVPLLVTGNKARPGQPLTGGGPDKPTTVAESSRSEISSFDQVGAWASERLGVPQLVPVIPKPGRTQWTTHLDRQSMLIRGTDLERVDRQVLRMTDHAREELLTNQPMHDKLLFWGNSSPGIAATRMAVLHPEKVLAFASAGISGIATLPLQQLGDHTLKYPVGVADLEALTGTSFDADAFDDVNKFYIHGAHDTHNFLKFQVPGKLPGVWADPAVYETAKAVYGRDMVEDHFPRCQIAFEKAGISAQFRLYPEMTHDPEPAGADVLEFFRRSIEGDDVSGFGQRLTLPFDRTVELHTTEPTVGDTLQFAVSGEYPPPKGLVTYTWAVDDGRSTSGPEAAFSFETAEDSDVSLTMETAHGQVAHRGMSLMARGNGFGAFRYEVMPPRTELLVGQSILLEIEMTNVGSVRGQRRLALSIDGERADSADAGLAPGVSKPILLSHPFDTPGEYEVRVPPAYRQTVSVKTESTPTANSGTMTDAPTLTSTATKTQRSRQDTAGTSAQTPGLGVVSALVGIGSAVSYVLLRDTSDDG